MKGKIGMKIGLPRGMFYYRDYILWEAFLNKLGFDIIVSGKTSKEILDNGVKYCSGDNCLPIKVFYGHVYSLKDKVDYVLVPRYTSFYKNEYTCPQFCGLPDSAFLNLKKQVEILEVKIHAGKWKEDTLKSLHEFSEKVGIKYKKVLEAFETSLNQFAEKSKRGFDGCPENKNQISDKAVAVLGHPYVIYDDYLSMELIKKLTARGIRVYTPENLPYETKRRNAYPYQGRVFWDVGLDILGSGFTYAADDNIEGIIYITPFGCGIDAFVAEFIEIKMKTQFNKPFLKITIDEHTGEAGFDTRLEAFLDVLGIRRNKLRAEDYEYDMRRDIKANI